MGTFSPNQCENQHDWYNLDLPCELYLALLRRRIGLIRRHLRLYQCQPIWASVPLINVPQRAIRHWVLKRRESDYIYTKLWMMCNASRVLYIILRLPMQSLPVSQTKNTIYSAIFHNKYHHLHHSLRRSKKHQSNNGSTYFVRYNSISSRMDWTAVSSFLSSKPMPCSLDTAITTIALESRPDCN